MIALLPSITSLAFTVLVAFALLAIISVLVIIAFQQHDPDFVKKGGLIGMAFRAITGRNPTLGEQFIILSPVAVLLIVAFWL